MAGPSLYGRSTGQGRAISTSVLVREIARGHRNERATPSAVDSNLEGVTHLSHPLVAQSTEALDQDPDGDAFHGVEVGHASPRDGVLAGLEANLTCKSSDRRRARSHKGASKPRDRCVP